MIEETRGTLDFCALRDAIERRDFETLICFYAGDAHLRIVYAALPDGPASELGGRAQIGRYLRAVCEQEIFCLVEGGAVFGEGTVRFREICFYPNGAPISVVTTLELAGGLIARQTDVVEHARGDRRREEGDGRRTRGGKTEEGDEHTYCPTGRQGRGESAPAQPASCAGAVGIYPHLLRNLQPEPLTPERSCSTVSRCP